MHKEGATLSSTEFPCCYQQSSFRFPHTYMIDDTRLARTARISCAYCANACSSQSLLPYHAGHSDRGLVRGQRDYVCFMSILTDVGLSHTTNKRASCKSRFMIMDSILLFSWCFLVGQTLFAVCQSTERSMGTVFLQLWKQQKKLVLHYARTVDS